MKRMITTVLCLVLLLAALPLAVSAEGECDINGHNFAAATCTDAKKCTICGVEEGEPLGHDWKEATCTKPKTCKRCNLTEGKSKGHEMLPATCIYPKRCKNCAKTVGEPLKHTAGKTSCGEKPKCIYCGKNMGAAKEHNYIEDWDDTCTICGHVRDVDYDYIIEVGEKLVIKQGGTLPLAYRSSDSSILEQTAQRDCSSPAENDTGYTYCTEGTFVGRKVGTVQICAAFGFGADVSNSWFVKVVKSDKKPTKSTAKPTAKPTTKPTTKPTESPITESTTEPTTEATVSTTESTTVPTEEAATTSTTVPTAVTAEPVPKKPTVWPIVGGVAAVIAVSSVVAVIFIKRKK